MSGWEKRISAQKKSNGGDEDQELQEAGRVGGTGVCGEGNVGGADVGAAVGRVVGIRLYGGSGGADRAGASEIHDVQGRGGRIFVHVEGQPGAVQEEFV